MEYVPKEAEYRHDEAGNKKDYVLLENGEPQSEDRQSFSYDAFMEVPAGGSITTTPIADGNTIFFGAATKQFFAVDAATGKEKWKFLTGDIIVSSGAIYKNSVIFASFDGFVYALDKETGRLMWRFKTNKRIWCSPVVVENTVYIGSCDEYLYAVEAGTGKVMWKFYAKNPIAGEVAAVNGMVIFGSYGGNIFSLDCNTGRPIWTFRPFRVELPNFAVSDGDKCIFNFFSRSSNRMPKAENGAIYFAGVDKYLYSLDLAGQLKWKFLTGNPATTCNFHNGVAYFGNHDNCLYAVCDGELYWKIRTGNWTIACPVIHEHIVYFTSMDQCLYAAAEDGTVLWKLMTGGAIYASPMIHKDVLYFGSDDTHLYAVNTKTQEILWRFHTGMPTKLMDTRDVKDVINHIVDFNKRIFVSWSAETVKGRNEALVQKPYTAPPGAMGEMPETVYGMANPYKARKGAYDMLGDKKSGVYK